MKKLWVGTGITVAVALALVLVVTQQTRGLEEPDQASAFLSLEKRMPAPSKFFLEEPDEAGFFLNPYEIFIMTEQKKGLKEVRKLEAILPLNRPSAAWKAFLKKRSLALKAQGFSVEGTFTGSLDGKSNYAAVIWEIREGNHESRTPSQSRWGDLYATGQSRF